MSNLFYNPPIPKIRVLPTLTWNVKNRSHYACKINLLYRLFKEKVLEITREQPPKPEEPGVNTVNFPRLHVYLCTLEKQKKCCFYKKIHCCIWCTANTQLYSVWSYIYIPIKSIKLAFQAFLYKSSSRNQFILHNFTVMISYGVWMGW